MNSLTLKDKGFVEFVPLKELEFCSLRSNKGAVVVLADSSITGKPASDILYIGRTKKPVKRIFGGYLAGYGSKTTRKISSKLIDDGSIEKVAISWMLTDNPKALQQELLENFKKDNGEYPAWNTSNKTPQETKPNIKVTKVRPVRKKPTKPVS